MSGLFDSFLGLSHPVQMIIIAFVIIGIPWLVNKVVEVVIDGGIELASSGMDSVIDRHEVKKQGAELLQKKTTFGTDQPDPHAIRDAILAAFPPVADGSRVAARLVSNDEGWGGCTLTFAYGNADREYFRALVYIGRPTPAQQGRSGCHGEIRMVAAPTDAGGTFPHVRELGGWRDQVVTRIHQASGGSRNVDLSAADY